MTPFDLSECLRGLFAVDDGCGSTGTAGDGRRTEGCVVWNVRRVAESEREEAAMCSAHGLIIIGV